MASANDDSNKSGVMSTKKQWVVGTLTYSLTGIIVLFLCLLWGDFAWAMKGRTVGSITTLMVKRYGISDTWYSILIYSIPNFTNIFLIPWISYKSDRHRGRFGRRIPYIFATTPIVTIAIAGLALSEQLGNIVYSKLPVIYPNLANMLDVNACRLMVFTVFWLLLDLGTTLCSNIYGALSNDVVPRQLIGRFQAFSRAVSLGIAVIFNLGYMKKAETHATLLLLIIAGVYFAGLTFMCLTVKEGEYPPVQEETGKHGIIGGFTSMVVNYGKQCFTNRYYMWMMAAMILPVLAGLPYNLFLIIYAKYLDMDLNKFGQAQGICFMVAFFMTFGLGYLSDKFHPIRTCIVSLAIVVCVNIYGGFFCRSASVLLFMMITHGITYMAYATLALPFAPKLFPRSIYAQLCSAVAMLTSIVNTLAAPILGYIMDATGHKYYLMFFMEATLEILSIIAFIVVYKYFIKFGGDKNYKAPEPAADI